jgi:hypothetical protein
MILLCASDFIPLPLPFMCDNALYHSLKNEQEGQPKFSEGLEFRKLGPRAS